METTTGTTLNSHDCFICSNKNVTTFELKGRKLQGEKFGEKIQALLENKSDYLQLLKMKDQAGVCRNCYSQINKVGNFVIKIRQSCATFLTTESISYSLSKRCALSPVTPKSVTDTILTPRICVGSSRKQLKMVPEFALKENITPITPINKTKNLVHPLVSEHAYAKQAALKQPPCADVLGIVKDSFKTVEQGGACLKSAVTVLKEVKAQASSLTSRTAMLSSVLYKYRGITDLTDHSENFLQDIVKEMKERIPFLFDVLCSVAVPASGNISEQIIPVLASCYSILMKHRYSNLSAYHRLTTIIATKGGLDERGQTRLNHMGLMLSSERRLKLQESAQEKSMELITEHLRSQPLIKLTGDNLDIYVKTSQLSKERRNRDLHLFTSNIIFSRIAKIDMNNDTPKIDASKLSAKDVLLGSNKLQTEKLTFVYSILLARILCKLPAFKLFKKLIPEHIPHEFMEKMREPSKVIPLPIQFKNEAKHADCLAIMDQYEEQLKLIHMGAFGNVDFLRKYKVPVGGDQLTRVRLQEAKNLRTLSVTPEKRFDDLHPIVCEMWHTKQDFLEKCYKTLYKVENNPGTLYHFKTILHRTNVNGKVKGRFQPHYDLLMAVGEGLIKEQFLEFFEMDDELGLGKPSHPLLSNYENISDEEKKTLILQLIVKFMTKYGYGKVDTPDKFHNDGQLELIPYIGKAPHSEPDELYNYCLQLCHWYLHLVELSDTAKEGDMNRLILNCKYNLPFFYSHSKLSKYLVENIDFILKCEYLLSPLQRTRVLEGSFVNTHGGKGKNVESDLVQEHSVCNQKSLIKTLGANKSEMAISRVTSSADTFIDICSKFDERVHLKPKSARHSKATSEQDQTVISKQLRKIRPFSYSPGRKLKGFSNVQVMPLTVKQIPGLNERIDQIIYRLTRGLTVAVDHVEEHDVDEIDNALPEL